MMTKIIHWSQRKKKYLINFVDQRLGETTNLDKKVNSDDLTHRYKGNTSDAKFNEFDKAFSLLDKIRDGKIGLADKI